MLIAPRWLKLCLGDAIGDSVEGGDNGRGDVESLREFGAIGLDISLFSGNEDVEGRDTRARSRSTNLGWQTGDNNYTMPLCHSRQVVSPGGVDSSSAPTTGPSGARDKGRTELVRRDGLRAVDAPHHTTSVVYALMLRE